MMNHHTISGPGDSELLERIVARDQAALSELYDRHGRLLYSVILAVVRDTDDAEEILEEIFVHIWNEACGWRADLGTPRRWMLRLAHNAAIDLLRSRRQMRREPDAAAAAVPTMTAPTATRSSQDTASPVNEDLTVPLAPALATLPLDERSVIDMAFLQGYSHTEIAEIIGVPPGTVRSRIRTGMIALRSTLGSDARNIGVGQSK